MTKSTKDKEVKTKRWFPGRGPDCRIADKPKLVDFRADPGAGSDYSDPKDGPGAFDFYECVTKMLDGGGASFNRCITILNDNEYLKEFKTSGSIFRETARNGLRISFPGDGLDAYKGPAGAIYAANASTPFGHGYGATLQSNSTPPTYSATHQYAVFLNAASKVDCLDHLEMNWASCYCQRFEEQNCNAIKNERTNWDLGTQNTTGLTPTDTTKETTTGNVDKDPEDRSPTTQEPIKTTATYGKFIPVIIGTVRLEGNVVEIRNPLSNTKTLLATTTSALNGSTTTDIEQVTTSGNSVDLLVSVAQGVTNITRIWADDELIFDITNKPDSATQNQLKVGNVTVYTGTSSQRPIPFSDVAYRGQCLVHISNFVFKYASLPKLIFEATEAASQQSLDTTASLVNFKEAWGSPGYTVEIYTDKLIINDRTYPLVDYGYPVVAGPYNMTSDGWFSFKGGVDTYFVDTSNAFSFFKQDIGVYDFIQSSVVKYTSIADAQMLITATGGTVKIWGFNPDVKTVVFDHEFNNLTEVTQLLTTEEDDGSVKANYLYIDTKTPTKGTRSRIILSGFSYTTGVLYYKQGGGFRTAETDIPYGLFTAPYTNILQRDGTILSYGPQGVFKPGPTKLKVTSAKPSRIRYFTSAVAETLREYDGALKTLSSVNTPNIVSQLWNGETETITVYTTNTKRMLNTRYGVTAGVITWNSFMARLFKPHEYFIASDVPQPTSFTGYPIIDNHTYRAILEPLSGLYDFTVTEDNGKIFFGDRQLTVISTIEANDGDRIVQKRNPGARNYNSGVVKFYDKEGLVNTYMLTSENKYANGTETFRFELPGYFSTSEISVLTHAVLIRKLGYHSTATIAVPPYKTQAIPGSYIYITELRETYLILKATGLPHVGHQLELILKDRVMDFNNNVSPVDEVIVDDTIPLTTIGNQFFIINTVSVKPVQGGTRKASFMVGTNKVGSFKHDVNTYTLTEVTPRGRLVTLLPKPVTYGLVQETDYLDISWDILTPSVLGSTDVEAVRQDYTTNVLIVGKEIIKFNSAVQLSSNVVRYTGLWRGRRGSYFYERNDIPANTGCYYYTDASVANISNKYTSTRSITEPIVVDNVVRPVRLTTNVYLPPFFTRYDYPTFSSVFLTDSHTTGIKFVLQRSGARGFMSDSFANPLDLLLDESPSVARPFDLFSDGIVRPQYFLTRPLNLSNVFLFFLSAPFDPVQFLTDFNYYTRANATDINGTYNSAALDFLAPFQGNITSYIKAVFRDNAELLLEHGRNQPPLSPGALDGPVHYAIFQSEINLEAPINPKGAPMDAVIAYGTMPDRSWFLWQPHGEKLIETDTDVKYYKYPSLSG